MLIAIIHNILVYGPVRLCNTNFIASGKQHLLFAIILCFFLLRLDSVREQLCLFEDTLFHWSMSLSFDESQSVCPENYNFRLLPNETFTLLNVKPLLDELSRCSYALDQFPMP